MNEAFTWLILWTTMNISDAMKFPTRESEDEFERELIRTLESYSIAAVFKCYLASKEGRIPIIK